MVPLSPKCSPSSTLSQTHSFPTRSLPLTAPPLQDALYTLLGAQSKKSSIPLLCYYYLISFPPCIETSLSRLTTSTLKTNTPLTEKFHPNSLAEFRQQSRTNLRPPPFSKGKPKPIPSATKTAREPAQASLELPTTRLIRQSESTNTFSHASSRRTVSTDRPRS